MARQPLDPDPAVDAILYECRSAVLKGLGTGKKLSAQAEAGLVHFFAPKIAQRLKNGGNWKKEKKNPLKVARHLGQICRILSNGKEVTNAVAVAAASAVKFDEICPAVGGGGQWCV